jgi:hypothetical protein
MEQALRVLHSGYRLVLTGIYLIRPPRHDL